MACVDSEFDDFDDVSCDDASSDFDPDLENSPAPKAAKGKAAKAAPAPRAAPAKGKAGAAAAKPKGKAAAAAAAPRAALAPSSAHNRAAADDSDDFDGDGGDMDASPAAAPPKKKQQQPAGNGGGGGKAIEEIYQKKTQLEHILLRPDTYIGSTEKQTQPMWVHDGGDRLAFRPITYAPGLFKIFDEILVNAADNRVRDPTMDTLRVDISVADGSIRVWNNGDGIPVEVHREEGVYVAELIFGHLLTSSNYDDKEKKITGGRNGYGAKLANIFSTEFTVETCDGRRQRRFLQTFSANMSRKSAPKITACRAADNWTCITFKPDLAKFDMQALEPDTVALMAKRVYDAAGVLGKGCKVFLNGERLPVRCFADYVDLYLGPKDNGVPRVYERVSDRWELCVSATDGQFQQVSFVNSICTSKGGTHVSYVVDQLTKHLVEKLNKKSKAANVKPFMVKNHLWVFVNARIENPAFDSQTKETLTLKASSFGSRCELSAPLMDRVAKCGVVDNIMSFAAFKNQKELKKGDGAKRSRLTGIAKLSDANDAGTRNSHLCTLILTEGDSAKSLAMSGLSVVGHDHFGVFPLRGKLLNVRDATALQVSDNAEITHIKQILGLQHGKAYDDVKALRYGSLMIMTDQDHDGSHIKGLIMNFLHTFYPSLLKIPGFLVEFVTPIVKARKGARTLSFYTMPEYEAWRESLPASSSGSSSGGGWEIKYYKGLGTSSAKEAKEYFAAMDAHKKRFVWEDADDGESIEMAFSKKRVEDRKRWLSAFRPGTYLDQSVDEIRYRDFVHKELILFSRADLERSIPSVVDGLKPGQRKILYCCFKRNLKRDLKVAQLAGYVSEHSAYHHGEASLQATIVGLAQDFVGSNNLNLLHPSGQFGTRLQGGKDAASPRYIYTRLAALTRHVFNKADDKLLAYLNEEGQSIEPEWYMPILPMVLVNGAEGIGTGWSTFIPNYSPRDVAANLRRLLRGEPLQEMQPWYRGFAGAIAEVPSKNASGRSYQVSGVAAATGASSLTITELPVRTWTQPYKEFLETLLKGEDAAAGGGGKDGKGAAGKKKPAAAAARKKKKAAADDDDDDDDEDSDAPAPPPAAEGPLVADYREHHTDVSVHFDVDLVPGKAAAVLNTPGGVEARFKLTSKISTGNMMLFDAEGKIRRYDSPEQILQEFFELRLAFYERRRQGLLDDAAWDHRRASNKIRFIRAVISGELVIASRRRADVEAELEAQGYARMARSKDAAAANAAAAADAADAGDGDDDAADERAAAAAAAAGRDSYDYLLGMAMYSLTAEKVAALTAEADAAAAEVARLERADIREMWADDLDAFLEAYEQWEADEAAAAVQLAKQQQRHKAKAGGGKAAKGKAARGGRKANPWSDDDGGGSGGGGAMLLDDDDDDDDAEFVAKPRKPAAPRALKASKAPSAAAAAPKPAALAAAPAAPAAAAAAAAPAYKVPTAAPPRGSKAAKAGAAAPAAAAAAAAPAPAADSEEDEAEPMSLAERLKRMALKASGGGGGGGGGGGAAAAGSSSSSFGAGTSAAAAAAAPAPARAPRAAAAAKPKNAARAVVVDSEEEADDDDDFGSDSSDPYALPSDDSDGGEAFAPAAAANKRKPRGGKPAAAAAYDAPTPSPAAARQKKARSAAAGGGGSPLPPAPAAIKPAAAAKKAPAPAAAAAAKKKKKAAAVASDDDDSELVLSSDGSDGGAAADDDDGDVQVVAVRAAAAAAPRVRRAPAAKAAYVELSDGGDEEEEEDDDEYSGSDDDE